VKEDKVSSKTWRQAAFSVVAIIILGAVAIWYFSFRQAPVTTDVEGAPKTIAVLPFDDLSPEKDQEHFVLGLSEEILNSISNISGLHVTSKTSSFAFKDADKTIKEIAEILEREYILEGSVRKAGDSLRITAQLISVVDDRHFWSETYDRELEDIFKIQEDIANTVADKLKLTIEAFNTLGGTENIEAYELYLDAKGLNSNWEHLPALDKITAAISLDQKFALAWTLKVYILLELAAWNSDYASDGLDLALTASQKAIEHEPMLGESYLALGSVYAAMGEFIEAEKNYQKGLDLASELKGFYGYERTVHYIGVGYLKKTNELMEKMLRDDPLNPNTCGAYILALGCLGDMDRAVEEYKRNKPIFGTNWFIGDVVVNSLSIGTKYSVSINFPNQTWRGKAWSIIGANSESPEKGIVELRRLYSSDSNLTSAELTNIGLGAGIFGDYDFAVEAMEKSTNVNVRRLWKIWLPIMQETRKTTRFKEFVKEIGLVDYWKEYGWPDLCRPVGDDDFVCD
jgi:TolB-like protein